jgi:hypothetical protein
MKEMHDDKNIYCKSLGHEVTFSYCRQLSSDSLCSKIADCWYAYIDIAAYLNENFSKEEREKLAALPKPKILSLFELIEEAKKRTMK